MEVFEWFKTHVIDKKPDPSIDHRELDLRILSFDDFFSGIPGSNKINGIVVALPIDMSSRLRLGSLKFRSRPIAKKGAHCWQSFEMCAYAVVLCAETFAPGGCHHDKGTIVLFSAYLCTHLKACLAFYARESSQTRHPDMILHITVSGESNLDQALCIIGIGRGGFRVDGGKWEGGAVCWKIAFKNLSREGQAPPLKAI
ncbi:hypothetical protein D5086_004314 [Populus alba]|uniref:Uncharacterized protein n=1 Tax=Populus alba TaxID=43335 RepID=A0ACC4CR90_POPAL